MNLGINTDNHIRLLAEYYISIDIKALRAIYQFLNR